MSEFPITQDRQEINPYVWMDQQDDKAIVAEITGNIQNFSQHLEKGFYYQFGSGKNEVVGLSKSGVNECVRQLQVQGEYISEVGTPEYKQCPIDSDYVLFVVTCEKFRYDSIGNKVVLETVTGTKRQATFEENYVWEYNPDTRRREKKTNERGEYVKVKSPDKFWFEKGKAKAARNAKMELIPFGIRVQVLENARKIVQGVRFQQPQPRQKRQLPQQPKQLPEPEKLPDFTDKQWSKKTIVPNRFLAPSMQNQKVTFWRMATDNKTKFTHNNGNQHTLASWLHVANYHGTEWEPVFQKTSDLRKWWKAKQAKEQQDTPPWEDKGMPVVEAEFVEHM